MIGLVVRDVQLSLTDSILEAELSMRIEDVPHHDGSLKLAVEVKREVPDRGDDFAHSTSSLSGTMSTTRSWRLLSQGARVGSRASSKPSARFASAEASSSAPRKSVFTLGRAGTSNPFSYVQSDVC